MQKLGKQVILSQNKKIVEMASMIYRHVRVASLGYTIPTDVWTSDEIESRLDSLYQRLKLPHGRLELMTGIRERRFWPIGTRPSQLSIQSCRNALEAAGIDPGEIGCLIHGSVCRDFLEPATACTVHHHLGLNSAAVIYDVSNACLGILNGVLQAANMIELGHVRAAIVVGSEGGRQLVETTIESLNRDMSLTRKTVKPALASLTIGSASCAVLLADDALCPDATQLRAASCRANTEWSHLCQSDHDQAGANFQPLMATDSTELLEQGVATGVENFKDFLDRNGWNRHDIDKTICHQVGIAHQRLILESLQISPDKDFTTFEWLGNTGSAALPVTLALAAERQRVGPGDNVGLFGIGSGINCVMVGCRWNETSVKGTTWPDKSVAEKSEVLTD